MDRNMTVGVIIAAAGTGSRMHSSTNKPYMLLKGQPVIHYSMKIFLQEPCIEQIIIVAQEEEVGFCKTIIGTLVRGNKKIKVIAGGRERQDSVYRGLSSLPDDMTLVAIHDAARPLLTRELLATLINAARQNGAAIPGVKPKDTLKMVDGDYVSETLDRERIIAVQTPQIFMRHQLLQAYGQAFQDHFYATDDAAIYERYIGRVKVVPGDYRNLKITTPEDLASAALFIP